MRAEHGVIGILAAPDEAAQALRTLRQAGRTAMRQIGASLRTGEQVRDLAGLGVAVANAGGEVKAASDYVTEKGAGDGFAEAVERYLPYFLER